eukprot:766607-Hanusia_phi.AAC.7
MFLLLHPLLHLLFSLRPSPPKWPDSVVGSVQPDDCRRCVRGERDEADGGGEVQVEAEGGKEGGGALRQEGRVGRRQKAGGRRQEAGGRRKEAGGRRKEAGGRRQEEGGRRQGSEKEE